MLKELVLSAVTFYCPCVKCTGHAHPAATSSGKMPVEGWTAACPAGWRGRMIQIEGVGVRQCEDTGSAIVGRRLDVFVESHAQALKLGILHKVRAIWWEGGR